MTWVEFKQEQPYAAKMIKSSLEKNRISHAYLFEGERGTGKRAAAMLFVESLLCEERESSSTQCGQCVNCKRIKSGNHPDVHLIEPDGLSIKINQIRTLRTEFSKSGVESKKKMYVIIDAEKMTIPAANSLLKFLEEPNSETTAILVTEQPQQILPTILSRCQTVSFKSIPSEILSAKLQKSGVHFVKAPLLAAVTNNFQEAMNVNDDDWFAQARNIVFQDLMK